MYILILFVNFSNKLIETKTKLKYNRRENIATPLTHLCYKSCPSLKRVCSKTSIFVCI